MFIDWLQNSSLWNQIKRKWINSLTLLNSASGFSLNDSNFDFKMFHMYVCFKLALKGVLLLLPKFYASCARRQDKIKVSNNVRSLNSAREILLKCTQREKIPTRGCPDEFLSGLCRTKWMTQVCFLKTFGELGMCAMWLGAPICCYKVPQHYFILILVKTTKHPLPFVSLRIYKQLCIDKSLSCVMNVNGTDPSTAPSFHISVIDYQ